MIKIIAVEQFPTYIELTVLYSISVPDKFKDFPEEHQNYIAGNNGVSVKDGIISTVRRHSISISDGDGSNPRTKDAIKKEVKSIVNAEFSAITEAISNYELTLVDEIMITDDWSK